MIRLLRADLAEADFTVDALRSLWGERADAALARGERVAALRALDRRATTPLATLARLFVLGVPVRAAQAVAALPRLGLAGAERLGLTASGAGEVRPLVDLRPYAVADAHGEDEWWIASDLGELALGGALREDHVLGVGGASTTLSGLILPSPAERVLDLGTGCGIQAMHAARLGGAGAPSRVVATDISGRALELAALNLALNAVPGVDLRRGSLYEPVAGELFDRIVSNPPFVITPRLDGVPSYEYRDGGLVGDALVEAVVTGAAEHLAPGGTAQLLANWEYRDGADGLGRVRGWLDGTPLEYWIVERERQDPAEYAETWIRDGGTRSGTSEFDRLIAAWLDDFEQRGVDGVGFGYVVLRMPRADGPRLRRTERLAGALPAGAALGPHLAACLAAHDRLPEDDSALAGLALTVAADVTEERHLWPGEDDPTAILLRQGGGFGRVVPAGTALAGLVGACDGELPLGVIAAAVAELLDVDGAALWAELAPGIRELVIGGLLVP